MAPFRLLLGRNFPHFHENDRFFEIGCSQREKRNTRAIIFVQIVAGTLIEVACMKYKSGYQWVRLWHVVRRQVCKHASVQDASY